MKAYSVKELSDILKACFENPAFQNIQVYGEVYSLRLGKFSYIELGDQGNKQTNSPLLKCAFSCYYGNDYGLEDIKVGDVISVTGALSYYSHGSSITLWGKECQILQSQLGKNLLAKKKTLEKLEKLGLLDEKRKRNIPTYCHKIAILTAETGAAYQDILKTLHQRFPVSSVLYPIVVQGNEAARSIVHALTLCQDKDYDCILLGRGGGSKTDLACFDDEKVALAIAHSQIPVITCIGHTIDTAIADRVSDKQAITPTEGAALINPSLNDTLLSQQAYRQALWEKMDNHLRSASLRWEAYQAKLESLSPCHKVEKALERCKLQRSRLTSSFKLILARVQSENDAYREQLKHAYVNQLQQRRNHLTGIEMALEILNPEKISQKGYALLYKDGKRITSSEMLFPDDMVEITYADGRVKAQIKE